MKEWVSAKAAANVEQRPHHHHHHHSTEEQPIAAPRTGGSSTNLAAAATSTAAPTSATDSKGSTVGKLMRKMSTAAHGTSATTTTAETRRPRTDYELRQMANAMNNSQDLPFEMHAFEALLTTVMALETQEFNRVNAQVQIILNYFRSGKLYGCMSRFKSKVKWLASLNALLCLMLIAAFVGQAPYCPSKCKRRCATARTICR
jgi:hypothetical protein